MKSGRKTNVERARRSGVYNTLQRATEGSVAGGPIVQLCITAHTVDKVLDAIPANTKIDVLSFRYTKYPARIKAEVPRAMKELGVRAARTRAQYLEVEGTLRDVSASKAKKTVHAIAEHYGLDLKDIQVRNLTLNREGAVAMFEFSTKEVRETADLRRKTKVLGLVAYSRDPKLKEKALELVSELSPKNYQCRFVVVEKKAVICASLK